MCVISLTYSCAYIYILHDTSGKVVGRKLLIFVRLKVAGAERREEIGSPVVYVVRSTTTMYSNKSLGRDGYIELNYARTVVRRTGGGGHVSGT